MLLHSQGWYFFCKFVGSCCFLQVKEQKEEAERFQQKLKEMEDLKIESFLVQLFHVNKVKKRRQLQWLTDTQAG